LDQEQQDYIRMFELGPRTRLYKKVWAWTKNKTI